MHDVSAVAAADVATDDVGAPSSRLSELAWVAGAATVLVVSVSLLGPIALGLAAVAALAAWMAGRRGERRAMEIDVHRLVRVLDSTEDVPDGPQPDTADLGALSPVAARVARLKRQLESAIEAATTDRLTHVANRPMLLAKLYDEVERSSRYGRPLTVAFLDIDHFKPVNDTYGHEIGDAVLVRVASAIRQHIRRSDIVGRYGGEEFVIVYPETTVDEATAIAEKLRVLIAKLDLSDVTDGDLSVTVSIGLAGGHGQLLRVDDLLRDADAAMYAAKSLGRNQTYVFAEIDDDSSRIPRAPISPAARAAAAAIGEQGRRAAEAALASAVMPLEHYAGRPSSLIATIAVRLARQLELPEAEIQRIRVASLLHDIGKVGVPDEILEKRGPLSPDEWQVVVQHPRIGQEIINRVAAIKDAAAIILHHHERFSGHGYPHGLRGSDIPLGARIVAIADAYEAMMSDRPYRDAIGHEAAIMELRSMAGTQFDPDLVELFCSLYAESRPEADPSMAALHGDELGQRRAKRAGSNGRRSASSV